MTDPEGFVSIRAHFEKFPATVKGAFVLRSADPNPHQVAIRVARLAELSGAGSRALDLQPATIDVAPRLDFFVPFEFPVTELEAGWYGLEADVEVDGYPLTVRPDRRFVVTWPRATMRRGAIKVGEKAEIAGGPIVVVDHVDLAGDLTTVSLIVEPAGPVSVRMQVDGDRHAVLETDVDEETGRGMAIAYPVPKTREVLTVEVGHGRSWAAVEVPLG